MPADVVVLWQEVAEGKVGRCPLICDIPHGLSEMTLLIFYVLGYRNDGMESRYSIFVTFDGQNSTDAFHKHLMDVASHLLRQSHVVCFSLLMYNIHA
ncbi:hypothetical protein Hanom_Chr11g01051121 [Helianthus anomalus]